MRLKAVSPQLIRKGAVVAFGFSTAALVVMFLSTTTPKTWQGLMRFNPVALIAVAGLLIATWLIEGLRLQLISRILGERLPLPAAFSINLATLFSGNITPFTSGGAPTQVYLLHKKGLSLGRATVVVTLRMALTALFFTVGGPILLFIFQGPILRQLSLQAWTGPIRVLLLAALAFSIGVIYILCRPARGEIIADRLFGLKLVRRILGDKTESLRAGFLREVTDFHESLLLVTRQKRWHLVLVLFYTFLYWMAFFSIAPAILLGFGFSVEKRWIWFILLQFVLSFLLSFIPIPGGSGVAEMGFYSVFSFFVPKHLLALFVAFWRFLSYHLSTFVGGIFFVRLLRREEPFKVDLPG